MDFTPGLMEGEVIVFEHPPRPPGSMDVPVLIARVLTTGANHKKNPPGTFEVLQGA